MSLTDLKLKFAGLKNNIKPHYSRQLAGIDQYVKQQIQLLRTEYEGEVLASKVPAFVNEEIGFGCYLGIGDFNIGPVRLPACIPFTSEFPYLVVEYSKPRYTDAARLISGMKDQLDKKLGSGLIDVQILDYSSSEQADAAMKLLQFEKQRLNLLISEKFGKLYSDIYDYNKHNLGDEIMFHLFIVRGFPGSVQGSDLRVLIDLMASGKKGGCWIWFLVEPLDNEMTMRAASILLKLPTIHLSKDEKIHGFQGMKRAESLPYNIKHSMFSDSALFQELIKGQS